MKKCPRWAAMLAALTVIATSTLVPLEGAAAPGPIKFFDDPRYVLGEPDGPGSSFPGIQVILYDFVVRIVALDRPQLRPLVTRPVAAGDRE